MWLRKILFVVVVALCTVRSFETDLDQNVSAIKSVKTSGGRAAFERENGICSDDWESPPLTESEISKSKFFSESSSQTESNFESMNSEFTSSNTNSEFESMTSKNEFFSQSSLSQSEYEATNFQINSSNVNSEVHNDDYSASTFKSESSQNIVKSTEEKSTSFNDSPSWNSGWDNKPRSNPELDFNKFREETPFSSSLQGLDQQNNQVPLHDFPADTVNNMNSEQENMFKFPNNNLDKIEFESVPIKEETEIPTQWPHLKKPEYDFGDLTESSPLHSLPTQSEQNSPKSSEDFPSQNDLHLPFPSEINDHEGSSNQSNTDSSEEKGDKKCKFGESVESNESPIDCLKSTTEEAEHMEDQVSENPELNSEKASLTSSIVNAPDSNAYSDLLSNQPSTLRPSSGNIPSTGSEKLASPISESLDSLAKSPKESKFEQPEHGPFELPEETSPFHTDFPKESMPGHPGSLEESLPCHHESSEESSPCYPELLIKQLPCHRESSEESSPCHPELPTEPLPCHPGSSEELSSCHRDSSEKSKPDYPRSPVEPIFNHYGSSEELLPHSSEFSTESFSHYHGSSEELLPCYPEYPIQPLPFCHGSSVESSPCYPELPLEPLPCHPESIKELPSCHFDSLEKSIPNHLRSPVEPTLCLNGSSEESSSCDQESPEELAPCYPEFPVEPSPCHQEVPPEKLCHPNLSEGSSPCQPDSSEESFPHHLDYLEESKPYYPEFPQEPLSCLHSSEEHGSSEESSQRHPNSSEELNPCTNSSEEMIPCHCHSPEKLLPGHPDTLEKLSSCHCQSVSPVEPFHSQPGYMEELPESENIAAAKSVSSNKSPLGPVSPLTTPPNGLSGLIKPYPYNQSSLSYPQTSFPYGTPSPYEHPDYPRGLPYQKNIPHPYASNLFPPGTLDSPHKYSPTTIPSHYPQKHPSFGQPGNSEPPLYEYPSHGCPPHGYPPHGYPPHEYPPHEYPPHGYPPHGYPPHGYPPHGYPPYGYPPYGYPPHGYPPHGYPPPGYPSHGYPPYRYSPNGYPFNTSPYEHPFGGSPYGPYNPHRKPPNGSPGSHTTKPPYNQNVPLNNIPTSSSQPSAYGQSGFDETPESLLDQFPHMENTLPKEASNVLPYTSEGSPLESTNPWEQYQNEHSNFPEKSLYDATTNSTPAPELSNMSNLNDLPFEKSHHGQPFPSSTNQSEMSDSTPTTFPFHPKPSEEESCGESSFPSQPPNMNKSSPGQDYFSSSKLPYLDAGSSGSELANPEAMYPLSLKPGRTFLPRGTSPFPSSHKLESSLELESQYPSSINQYPLNENSESPDDLHGPNSLQMRPPTHSCNKQYPEKPLHGPYGFEEDCLAPNTNPCSPDQQDLLHETSHNPKNPLEPTFQPVNTEEFANKLQHSPEDDSFYPQTTPYSSHKPDYPKNPLELMINYGPEEKMGFPPSLHNTEEHLKQPFLIDSKNFETNSEYPQKKLPWPNQTSNMLKSSLSDMPTSNFVLPENGVSPKSTSELPADDLHPPKSASELLADDLHQTHPPITSSLNRNSVTPDDLLSSLPETQDSIMPNTSPLTTSNTVTPDILSSLQKSPEASILQNSPSHPETAALPSNNPAAQNDLLSSLPDTQDSITPDIASLSNSNAVIPDNLSLLQKSPEDSILQNLPSHPETASLPDRNPGTSVDLTLPDSNPGTSVDLTSAFPETLEDSIMPENAPSPSTNLETPVHLPSTPDSISNPSSLPLPDSNPISNKHTSSGRGRMKGVPVTDSVPEYVLNDLDQLYEETKSKYLSCYSEYPQNIGEIIDSLDDESLTYHTVIVGSGAGALSALKDLVDANKSVLIVEQGRLPPQKCMSMYYRSGLLNTNYVTPYKASIPGCSVEKIIFAPNVVGGTTSYDLNTWDHGALEKYRNWGQDCKKWSWEKVAKHYQSMEMTEKTERNTQEREEILPNGSIVITRDITETATTKRVIKAFREVGIRESSYELDGARRSPGITIIPMIHQRQDNSLYAQRMFEQIKNKDNLHIALETEATQIIFENGKAVAVTIVTPSGSIRTVHIKEELILGGGPISTVNILYHSGIGDASLLQQLQIPVQSHVPHLGKDLMVYPMYPALCMKFPSGSLIAESESDYAAIGHMFGETTMSPGLALSYYKAFLQVYDSPQPNVQINLFAFSKRMPTRMKNYMSGLFQFDKETQEYVYRMSEQHDLMFVVPQLLDTESKGEITINSADYRAQPVINTGMYNSGRDLMIMEKTIGIIKRLSKTKTFRGISGELVQIPVRGCEGAPFTKQFNECSIRHCSVPGLHPTGGAIMGHNPLTSVVDEELIVHGTKNVRCFSAAVLPKGVAADSSAAACVVGKYGAALMLGN